MSGLVLVNRGVGVFFARQDDRPGVFNWQLAIAAEVGNTRYWILGQLKYKQQGVKWRGVAAARLARRQPGILTYKKYPDPSVN